MRARWFLSALLKIKNIGYWFPFYNLLLPAGNPSAAACAIWALPCRRSDLAEKPGCLNLFFVIQTPLKERIQNDFNQKKISGISATEPLAKPLPESKEETTNHNLTPQASESEG